MASTRASSSRLHFRAGWIVGLYILIARYRGYEDQAAAWLKASPLLDTDLDMMERCVADEAKRPVQKDWSRPYKRVTSPYGPLFEVAVDWYRHAHPEPEAVDPALAQLQQWAATMGPGSPPADVVQVSGTTIVIKEEAPRRRPAPIHRFRGRTARRKYSAWLN